MKEDILLHAPRFICFMKQDLNIWRSTAAESIYSEWVSTNIKDVKRFPDKIIKDGTQSQRGFNTMK